MASATTLLMKRSCLLWLCVLVGCFSPAGPDPAVVAGESGEVVEPVVGDSGGSSSGEGGSSSEGGGTDGETGEPVGETGGEETGTTGTGDLETGGESSGDGDTGVELEPRRVFVTRTWFYGDEIGNGDLNCSTAAALAGLGIAGITIIFWPEVQDISISDRMFIGACLSLTGALLASFGNIVSQAAQREALPVMPSTAWGMLYGGLLNAVIAFARGQTFVFDPSPAYVITLLFLAIFGSVVAFGCYLTLLGRIGANRAGYSMVMIPIVALVLSALFEGLELEPHILIGVSLALAGNVAILARGQLARRRARAALAND